LKPVTFLLDMDDTLLGNSMEVFLPAYFTALGKRLHSMLAGNNLRQIMAASIQAIQTKPDPAATNLDAFMADFTRRLDVSADVIQPILDDFYQTDFPQLERFTSHRPLARTLVERLQAKGCTVVVATNPLFPEVAIKQRLAWAGLADMEFARVTTMENSHYSKPAPNYYREILQTVGGLPQTAMMVGDDWQLDIVPALGLGLQTWWITDHLESAPQPPLPQTRFGPLQELVEWVSE